MVSRGEIWWAHTPGRPGDLHQPRPVLVVSENVRNRRLSHVLVVPIYSSARLGPTRVEIEAGDGGLRRSSVIVCEEVSTIEQDFLDGGPLGGRVPDALLAQVVRAIRIALGDVLASAM